MSSGLRHVLKTRDFRERSQPAARAKFGLLEKHKDYVLRARDFHRKQASSRSLPPRALCREAAALKRARYASQTRCPARPARPQLHSPQSIGPQLSNLPFGSPQP